MINMILGIDIGNSNIVIGCVENHSITCKYRIVTDTSMTAMEYRTLLERVMKKHKNIFSELEGAVISSVVRPLTAVLSQTIQDLTGHNPMLVSSKLNSGLCFAIDEPEELGCDRIANCAAAVKKYPLPLIVIDFGTATTISVVGEGSVFLGGAIAPGLKTSVNALCRGTSQLSEVDIEAPSECIGKNTDECIKSGIVLGAVSMAEGMIERIEGLLGANATVIATGGLASIVLPHCKRQIIRDDDLLLEGLDYIYHNAAPRL